MRRKASRVKSDNDRYSYRPLLETTKKRLDLNDLLMRAKNEEKNDKKFNLLVFFGVASVVLVFFLLLNL